MMALVQSTESRNMGFGLRRRIYRRFLLISTLEDLEQSH